MTTSPQKLPVVTGVGGAVMADTMFGDGIVVTKATYTGDALSGGIFSNGWGVSPTVVPADAGVILSTGRASDFTNATGAYNQTGNRSTDTAGIDGDARMNGIAGVKTFDGAFLTTEFTSTGDELTMQLVFSSEEYLEWVNSGYNDAVGIWVNGVQAQLALGGGDISIDNINTTSNPNLFLNNTKGAYNTEMDGATVVLTLKASVKVGAVNTLVIGIADAGDTAYDSTLMVVANSVQSALIAHDDQVLVTAKGVGRVDLVANDMTAGRSGVHVTALNGQQVAAGGSVVLKTGEVLTLNADGSVGVVATAQTAPATFSYQITDAAGTTDTAFVTVIANPVDGTEGSDAMGQGFSDAQGNMIDGGDGLSEVILGKGGNDKITAGQGDDDIYGGTGHDFMRAGDGNDLLDGGEGNDVLDGGAGADRMVGGAGNDVFYIHSAQDQAVEAATGGYDKIITTLSHTMASGFEELWLRAAAQQGTGNAAANKIVGNDIANAINGLGAADQLWGGAGADSLAGGLGQDLLFGGVGGDVLWGDDGSDKLYGEDDADSLFGGAGSDSITAGAGDDTLTGDGGNDLLLGGEGADLFVFATAGGTDRIKDFALGSDSIAIAGITAGSVEISQHGSQLWLQWGTADKVILCRFDAPDDLTPQMLGIGGDLG